MKHILLSAVVITALILSACEQQSDVNEPADAGTSSQSLLRAVENLNLTDEQLTQLDEMFWMEEDLSLLLNPAQTECLNEIIDGMSPGFGGGRDPQRIAFDMGALVHMRLILKANPDLDETTRQALLDLIKASNEKRLEILAENAGDPEAIRQKLQEEHAKLIEAMNGLLTAEQLQNVENLKEEIRQLREEMRQKWVELRIDFQLRMWKQVLGLTEEQVTAIRQLLIDQHAAIEQARLEIAGDPEALREALKEILENTDTKIKALLTEEQAAKWDRLKGMRLDWRRGHRGGGIGPRG